MTATLPLILAAGWRPFLTAMPAWDYWFWFLVPLSAAVAVVYKATKCRSADTIVREAAVLTVWILAGFIGAAAAVALVVRVN